MALIQLVTLVFANMYLKPRTKAKKLSGWVDWSAFRDARFNHYAITTFLSLLGLYISIFFIVDFSRTSISPPLSYQNGLNLLMIFNGVNAIGRFGSGLVADRYGALVVFVPVLATTGIILFAWISVKTVPSMYVWTVFCGIFSGGIQALFPAGLGYLTAGTEKPGTRMGMIFGLGSVATSTKMENEGGYSGIIEGTDLFLGDFTEFDQVLSQPNAATTPNLQGQLDDGLNPESSLAQPRFGNTQEPGNYSIYGAYSNLEPAESSSLTRPTLSNPQTETGNSLTPPKTGKRLSLNSVRILNKWLSNHTHHPYPSVRDVESMERQTGLSRQQILNWFANARRRKKFKPPETTDNSSSEASPRDIPLPRPPTPIVQQSPLERWENSPPEDEPSSMAAIARAVSGASDSIDSYNYRQLRSGRAPSSAGTWATSDTSDSSRSSRASGYSHTSNGSLRRATKKRRRGGLRARNDEKRGNIQVEAYMVKTRKDTTPFS
ncbi:hypothetical protein IL306_009414 [Fusarium sp. DS 682]|nr:hypothetical protein IL306_009414 [Fusarium sp. DS 682]